MALRGRLRGLVLLETQSNDIGPVGVRELADALPSCGLETLHADSDVLNSHPSLSWRRRMGRLGVWHEARARAFPSAVREAIATVLVLARSQGEETRTRTRAVGLDRLSWAVLVCLFKTIASLNYDSRWQ